MLKKKVKGPKKEYVMGEFRGSGKFLSFYDVVIGYSGVRGGGKCPEEEHTTCSGGPTMLLSQARFTGIEKLL
jgi:hypothetical protein